MFKVFLERTWSQVRVRLGMSVSSVMLSWLLSTYVSTSLGVGSSDVEFAAARTTVEKTLKIALVLEAQQRFTLGLLRHVSNESGTVLVACERGVVSIGPAGTSSVVIPTMPASVGFVRASKSLGTVLVGDGEDVLVMARNGRSTRFGGVASAYLHDHKLRVIPAYDQALDSRLLGDWNGTIQAPWSLEVGEGNYSIRFLRGKWVFEERQSGTLKRTIPLRRAPEEEWPGLQYSPLVGGGVVQYTASRDGFSMATVVFYNRMATQLPTDDESLLQSAWSCGPSALFIEEIDKSKPLLKGNSSHEAIVPLKSHIWDLGSGRRVSWRHSILPLWISGTKKYVFLQSRGQTLDVRVYRAK